MAVDIKVIGDFPRADFVAARAKALDEVGEMGRRATSAAAPVQSSHPGGHPPTTLRDAITVRRLGKGTGIKFGIIGAKSAGYFGRFVEDGHAVVRVNSYERRTHKDGSYFAPNYAKQTRRGVQRGWKKVRTIIGTAAPHPFFFSTVERIAPLMGDLLLSDLENAVRMEKVTL